MTPTLYPAPAGALAPATAPGYPWRLLMHIWFRPRRAFEMLAAGPGWLWAIPLAGALALFYGRTFTAAAVGAEVSAGALIGGLAGILFGWLLRAWLLQQLGAMLGGRADFAALYRVSAWATWPLILRDTVQVGYMLVTGRPIVQPGLVFLVSDASAGWLAVIGRTMLERTDLYTIWFLALLVSAVALAARLSRGKAALAVACYALLSLAAIAAAALVNGALRGR